MGIEANAGWGVRMVQHATGQPFGRTRLTASYRDLGRAGERPVSSRRLAHSTRANRRGSPDRAEVPAPLARTVHKGTMRILNRNYEKVLGRTRQMAGLVRREMKSSVGRRVPLAARLRMIASRFPERERYVLYDLERNDSTLYLSDLSRFVRTFHINRSPHVLDDKFVFAVMLDSLQCRTAPLRALVGEGQFMSTDTGRRLDEAAVLELVARCGELVVKPRFGGGGGEKSASSGWTMRGFVVNSQRMAFADFVRLLRQEQHVVTDRIYQHGVRIPRLLRIDEYDSHRDHD